MIKELACLIGIIAVLITCGCMGSSLNSNPPDYVKSVTAIEDGPGLQIYFILADEGGSMTTADGNFVLEISQKGSVLFKSKPINVTKNDFEMRSVGMGNFEHDVIMYLIGRLPYEDMHRTPSSGIGEVKIAFTTPEGKTLEGDTNVYF